MRGLDRWVYMHQTNVKTCMLLYEGMKSLLAQSVSHCWTFFFFFLRIKLKLFLLLHLYVWAACCHRSIVLSASPFYCKRMSDSPLRHTHACYVIKIFIDRIPSLTPSFTFIHHIQISDLNSCFKNTPLDFC